MILRIDRTVQTAQGQAVSGAQFYVLTQPANTVTLTPLANVYSDALGTVAANPAITDGLGQVALYLDNSQLYTFVVVSPLISTQAYLDQNLGNAPSAVTPFGEVPEGAINGSNLSFTLTAPPRLLFVQYNSATLIKGLGYTLVGTTLTLAVAPQIGDSLYASGIL